MIEGHTLARLTGGRSMNMKTAELVRCVLDCVRDNPDERILVNDGDDRWGENAAVTEREARELIAAWNVGRDEDELYDVDECLAQLVEAGDCLADHHREVLAALASEAVGLRYDSPEAQRILNAREYGYENDADWSGFWPVCDARGILTGEITDSDDDEYANVADAAMVLLADLPAVERRRIRLAKRDATWDGYAQLV